ncbi:MULTISPECIES: caspase, EACC1-associated type [Streptomyces]|uniref:Peptidase C14 n=1 Tax=Streptomyces scabiei (strain 87.22) TaxID=680198 RepID=C9ZFU2_STRSW|nr:MULTISPECIES: AAA domain-containing protein [Streptomyces]MBP5931986.1 AAA family ATPase [Streptomyces sp. LBUM 1479]KFG08088.1 peptidase C14 [Streptomyces scabiei]MBP5894056.1 AAA family ATPase [Streptomyces sp. LBUM 1481]MBP5924313.1 AAA family ATPase [Streptomyces sp. LBUM 1483]MDX2577934.1 AAA domain-containing protein [Streptomyces scabiei]
MTDNDRFAMLVGVSTYDSDAYRDLPPVRADLHYMRAVLENTEIGMYNDCAMVAEPTRAEMLHAVETYLNARQPSETALLYFSGHGEFCENDNQLYFLTRDTDPDDLPGTAVPAEFLERMLQSCRAASKLVLLDCCSSGSVVQGWTAKGPAEEPARPAPSTLLRPTGVYFITASDALQSASAMAPDGSSLGTSRFTGEIVEGLRNGRIKEGGWITPDDLFEYLTAQMRRDGVPEEQRPTKSTIRATNQLPFARSVARPVHLQALPRDAAEAARRSPALLKARELAALDGRDGIDRERLLRYYAHCLTAQSAAGMRPDRDSGRGSKYFLLGQGEETIQSGRGSAFPAPGNLPKPQGGSAGTGGGDAGAQQEYWYGYPAITLPVRDGGARGRRTAVELAPLLIQQMELAPDEEGRDVLRPSGVPSLHTGVVAELLDAGDAADLVARWQPSWQEGNDAQMLRAVRELLDELGLPELEPLDPSALSERTVMQALRPGAHNAAVLLVPSGVEAKATEALVDNLLQMSTRTGQIPGTALDALLSGGEGGARDASSVAVVAPGPCNESQESVISSAMTRPLTVATGPPGTGKSEVVTAVVTTCVAAGQSVLVASTNNEAVNVVAERCDDIAPGLLMRTGNAEALEREAAKLERLLGEPVQPPRRGSATVGGQLRSVRKTADGLRAEAARHVGEEERLLELLQDRAQRTEALQLPLPLLEAVWAAAGEDGTAALGRWENQARKVAGAPWWLLGPWRRKRALAALVSSVPDDAEEDRRDLRNRPGPSDLPDRPSWPDWATGRPVPAALLESLADAVAVEREVRALVLRHTGWDEDGLRRSRLEATGALSELSSELSRAVSAETLTRARGLMQQRLQALRSRSGFQRSQKNLMAHIKGWAVSTHSVRQLELAPKLFDLVVIDEASQCSIPSVLPLLFRARRALIIGDPMQLGHIPGVSPQQEQQARVRAGLSAAQLEDHRLTYHVYSSYHAAEQHGDSALLLDEHYRCHPRIADIVNGYCYAGQLQVLTDVRRQVPALDPVGAADPAPALGWVDVTRGESARGGDGRSWRNAAEAEAVRRVVDELLARLPQDATVGVVTPFRAQKEALARVWRDDDRVRVGTVHAFQGGQRDVMVLSPVATHNTPPRTTHWVASQVNLWNVAVTRAKSQLITVGTHAFWQGQSGLPTLLAERSASLGADTDETDGPVVTATPATGFREELSDRLQQYLTERGITDLERATVVGGHPVDLLFTEAGENTAVLIDPGPPPGIDPARHLRLTHARGDLLTGLPSGGYGAKACPVGRTVRVPAWRVLADEEVLAPLFD